MLTKMVDGKEVAMSDAEEAEICTEWAASEAKTAEPKPKTVEQRLAELEALVKP